jgi:adenine-specific DNA-methyltransferase
MPNIRTRQKLSGAYFTPDDVAASLVRWAIRGEDDRLLDPSCGDGQFIARHRNAVGIEQDIRSARRAMERAPWALVHEGDFFSWASETTERFDCAAGNPPFIRYQTFAGPVREKAAALCHRLGAEFSGLASSWAPFLVATAALLNPGGRMAFVVPAEIGHAPYAVPLMSYLVANFSAVHVVAVREKLFPDLSEDCWLLYADGFGGATDDIRFTVCDRFTPAAKPPQATRRISIAEWRDQWKSRLRPYLLPDAVREAYLHIARQERTHRLGEIASVGIGYVSGANDFFHLRPSDAERWNIPGQFLHPTIRNGRALPSKAVTSANVAAWLRDDEPILLLRLPKSADLPASVTRYLTTDTAKHASAAYKCRSRDPWFSVPDVNVPDYFLSYMSGEQPSLVANRADCTCTNSVHAVRLKSRDGAKHLKHWGSPLAQLSTELEGHPLGGGMLKLEPREATQIILAGADDQFPVSLFAEATATLRTWRHHGKQG